MAAYPRADASRNCTHCHFYRPDDASDPGVCMRHAPTGEGNVVTLVNVQDAFSPIPLPDQAWCGEFRKYAGPGRTYA